MGRLFFKATLLRSRHCLLMHNTMIPLPRFNVTEIYRKGLEEKQLTFSRSA